jgi:endo-1,4-beta-xylanase
MHFSLSAASLALSGLAIGAPIEVLDIRQVAAGINAAMVAAGRGYIGTSLTIRSDSSESNIIKNQNEFGSITPENAMKWDSTEPNRGSFSFGGADQVMSFATQNKKQVRCHTLVWYSQLPSWVSNGGFNNQTLQTVMQNHINSVMGHYKGKCTHWDVVNEALNEDGTYRDNVFLQKIGEAYIPIAFKMAAAADPAAKLYYNDYNLEYNGPKTKGAVKIVKAVQSYGYRIDGVGFQGHLVIEKTPTQDVPTPDVDTLTASLKAMTDLNVDVAYTEVDIRMNLPDNATKQKAQADAYARVAQSCMNVPRCVGITIWVSSANSTLVPSVPLLTIDRPHRVSRTSTRGCRRPSTAKEMPCSGPATTRRSRRMMLS